jgi:hypothetical protein
MPRDEAWAKFLFGLMLTTSVEMFIIFRALRR